jgi:hypothetical protein
MRILITPRIVPVLLLCAFLVFLFSCAPSPHTPPPPASLVTIPTQLNFFTKPGTSPAARELDIGVANRISAKWSARADQPWLTIDPASGELPRNFTTMLALDRTTVSVDSSRLALSSYSANISVDADGQNVGTVPVRLYVTNTQPGDTLDIAVGQGTGSAWSAGIRIDGAVNVSAGTLDASLFRIGPDRGTGYSAGDMAVFVAGMLANDSDKEWQVDFWPEAFDAAGNQVAWGLDQGGAPLSRDTSR